METSAAGDTDTRGISSGQMGDALLPVDLISPTTYPGALGHGGTGWVFYPFGFSNGWLVFKWMMKQIFSK